jgi:predicted AAA+ superfamily ATPase
MQQRRSAYYDLLDLRTYTRLSQEPFLLQEEILALPLEQRQKPIIIDEIQKIPLLLNTVQSLIDREKLSFILCGSSARQLKNRSVNMLGGRAWLYHFFPLVSAELSENFDLLHVLQQGLLPNNYLTANVLVFEKNIQAYVDLYLKEEVQNEGLSRNLSGFIRFLDAVGFSQGEMVNFLNIARECALDRQTVQAYFQILIDTMMGHFIYPYAKKIKRDLITESPKFYLFDVGVANYIAKRSVTALKGEAAGKALEHFIFMELLAYIKMHRVRSKISYWRTKAGYEVDFILDDACVAIEVKISDRIHKQDLKGLAAFQVEHPHTKAIVVSQDLQKRNLETQGGLKIIISPWREFLTELWLGQIF